MVGCGRFVLVQLLLTVCVTDATSSGESCDADECVYAEAQLAAMESGSFAQEASVNLLQRHVSDDSTRDEEDLDDYDDIISTSGEEEIDDDDDISPVKCNAFDAAYPDLVKVDFALADNSVSNLGGLGPQKGAAEELYYRNVAHANAAGDMYDLRVTVRGDAYQVKNAKVNGVNGHYGVINVKCNTSVDLNFEFVDQKKGEPASLPSVVFSWFDLDMGALGGGEETVVLWPGHLQAERSSNSEVIRTLVPCPAGAGNATCRSFSSSTSGTGKDNPDNPLTLTALQASRTFSVFYKDVTSFTVTLKAGEGFGGRNFLFTGMSEVAYASVEECCPDHVCGCKSFCQDSNMPWEQKCSIAKCAACGKCTTTTTTAAPASKEETCNNGITFDLSTLEENTLGSAGGRMLFKNVVEHEGRLLDLTVMDAANDVNYKGEKLSSFKADRRDYTGAYKGAGRIAFDESGRYMFRFKLVDSQTGDVAKLSLFPLTLYDIDGKGEGIKACNVAGVITEEDTLLVERHADPCYFHVSLKKEVNIPQDFESLTLRQKRKTVTYVYRNTGEWDIGVTLHEMVQERYFLFMSSKVLACDYADKTRDKPWKKKGRAGDA